jgi:hypothetical protein
MPKTHMIVNVLTNDSNCGGFGDVDDDDVVDDDVMTMIMAIAHSLFLVMRTHTCTHTHTHTHGQTDRQAGRHVCAPHTHRQNTEKERTETGKEKGETQRLVCVCKLKMCVAQYVRQHTEGSCVLGTDTIYPTVVCLFTNASIPNGQPANTCIAIVRAQPSTRTWLSKNRANHLSQLCRAEAPFLSICILIVKPWQQLNIAMRLFPLFSFLRETLIALVSGSCSRPCGASVAVRVRCIRRAHPIPLQRVQVV